LPVKETVEGLADGSLEEISQENDNTQHSNNESSNEEPSTSISNLRHSLQTAPKFYQTTRIDWNKTVDETHNLIRGLSPLSGCVYRLEDKTIKFTKKLKRHAVPPLKPVVEIKWKNLFKVCC